MAIAKTMGLHQRHDRKFGGVDRPSRRIDALNFGPNVTEVTGELGQRLRAR